VRNNPAFSRQNNFQWGVNVKLNHLGSVSLSLAALLVSASAALALDANDFASKLTKQYAAGSAAKLVLGAATVNGNDVTFAGFTITPKDDKPVEVKTPLTFHNVAEGGDGSYTADSLTVPDVDYTDEGIEFSAKNIVLSHLYVGNAPAPDPLQSSRAFGGLSVGPITVSKGGAPMASIAQITVNNSFKPSQTDAQLTGIESNGTASGLSVDLTKIDDADAKAQAEAFGVTQLNGKIAETASWSMPDGHLKISEMSVGFDELGKLSLAVDVTGYTPALVQALSTAGQAMSASDNSGQAATMQLMAAAQKLFVNNVSLRFDDASLTSKMIDFYAKQAGVPADAFTQGLIASAGAMSSGMGLPPALAGLAQAAVVAYLQNPKSLEIRLQPAAPVGVLDFMAAAMQPDSLIQQVGLKVLVDDQEVTPAAAGTSSDGTNSDDSDD
jgi:hypothetical protein